MTDDVLFRKTLSSDGLYVKGKLNGVEMFYTTDTGATRTVISDKLYNKIPSKKRPNLEPWDTQIAGAAGKPIQLVGIGNFDIELGPLHKTKELIVAKIEDDALLGMDILQNEVHGGADILLSEGIIKLQGECIPCIQVGLPSRTRRVKAAESVKIPGFSEALLKVVIDRDDNESDDCDLIIEPSDSFASRSGIVVASALVNIRQKVAVSVRVMNLYPSEVDIFEGAIIGSAGEVAECSDPIFDVEDPEEIENKCSIRRIKLSETVTERSTRGNCATEKCKVPDHLQELFESSGPSCSSQEKRVIANLLVENETVFSKHEFDIGKTFLTEHVIETGNSKPVKQPPRRVPLAFAEEEKAAIENLERHGIIKQSTSPWASPLVLVRKKSGGVRICVDYRKLNAVTVPDAFPLPRIQDCLDAVTGACLFSTFDLTSGYHQVPVKESDKHKTAFVTKYGLFEYQTMPFGLSNSAGTFQRVMEIALSGLQWVTCLIYIDDVVCFSKTFNEHVERVSEILGRIQKAGMKLKPQKCNLFQDEVTFLGHVVNKDGVKPNPDNIAKIIQWPVPKSVTEVRQFIGIASYYRRFVKDFAKVAQPLHTLLKKGEQFVWSSACQESFDRLKEILTGPEIMAFPRDMGEYILDTDACDTSIGCVLSQMQDGRERVIAYASRSLNKAEKNYCVTDKELLAVRYFMEYFRQYLLGRKFVVRTDHQALVWLFRAKEPKGRVARWIEILSAYQFSIEYRPGTSHGNADSLSRCDNPKDCHCAEVDDLEDLRCGPCGKCRKRLECVPEPTFARAVNTRSKSRNNDASYWKDFCGLDACQIQQLQMDDANVGLVYNWKVKGNRPPRSDLVKCSPETRHYCLLWDSLEIQDGVMYKLYYHKDGLGVQKQLVVPKQMRNDIMSQNHDSVLSGHLGSKKTWQKTRSKFYWFEMREDITLHVSKCHACAVNKAPSKSPRANLGQMLVGAPLDRVCVDILGPLPYTPRGNRYALVVMDYFTKWVEISPIPDQSAQTCADKILEFVCRFGCPLSIHSDQGRSFESEIFQDLCKILHMKKTRSSPRNPKCNGMVERFNLTLISMIRAFLNDEEENWDLNLDCLAAAYRATPSESTSLSPNLLMLGREVRSPVEIMYSVVEPELNTCVAVGEHVMRIRDTIQRAHVIARKYMQHKADYHKNKYDCKSSLYNYQPGDLVLYLHEQRKVGVCQKLQPLYHGPYVVAQKLNDLVYKIIMSPNGNVRVVHHDKLQPYKGRKEVKWAKRALKKFMR